MGVDRTGAGIDKAAEAAEEPFPPERRPPPDRPGAEGVPSRADSRNGAAAANETSPQAAENQGEDKPDTAQARQETEREDNTTVENEPEAPGTSESNEGPSNDDASGGRYDNVAVQEDPGGRPEPSAEIGDHKDDDQRGQPSDGRTGPYDSSPAAETDRQRPPAGASEPTADNDAGETSATDANDSVNANTPSAAEHGDRAGSRPKETEEAPVTAPDTQLPTSYSVDAPTDVPGDRTREPTRPAGDTAEAARPEAEGQEETTDNRQSNPPDQTLPGDAGHPSGGSQEKAEVGETSEQSALVLGDEDATARDRTLGERLMVDGKPLRERLDPVGAAAWSDGSVDVEPNPAGDRIADAENEKTSRVEELRKKFYEGSGDVRDGIRETTNSVNDLLPKHPPAGHAEVSRTPDNMSTRHDAISAGDVALALMTTAVVVGEVLRWSRGKLEDRKGV
jgi:hypothetical protein